MDGGLTALSVIGFIIGIAAERLRSGSSTGLGLGAGARAEEGEGKEGTKKKAAPSSPPAPAAAASPAPPAPTHQRYTLHRDIFALRLAEHRRRRQAAQAKELAPRLPGAPMTSPRP